MKHIKRKIKRKYLYFDTKDELMLSILSSLAESESKSISDNVTWAKRKRYADGFTTMRYKIHGYKVNDKGKP